MTTVEQAPDRVAGRARRPPRATHGGMRPARRVGEAARTPGGCPPEGVVDDEHGPPRSASLRPALREAAA